MSDHKNGQTWPGGRCSCVVHVYWPSIVSSLAAFCLVLKPVYHLRSFEFNCPVTTTRWLPVGYSGKWIFGGIVTCQSINESSCFNPTLVSARYPTYFTGVHHLQLVASVSTQHLTNIPRRLEFGVCCEYHVPRRGPSTKSEHIIFDPMTPAMSASCETYEDSVQVVENLIDSDLIDKAVVELQSGVIPAKEDITTKMEWTPACERLREFYVTNVHPKVYASTTSNDHSTDLVQIITRPKIASFVKSPAETQSTFKMIERINSTVQNHPIRRIRLPTDYHVLIPLVIEGLSPWIEVLSINERREVPWAKGSLVYLKGGTDLICSTEGGGVYILMGGKNKVVT